MTNTMALNTFQRHKQPTTKYLDLNEKKNEKSVLQSTPIAVDFFSTFSIFFSSLHLFVERFVLSLWLNPFYDYIDTLDALLDASYN